ncbi:hypothetical protein PC39_00575 [Salinisphaera sp. PC39]|uniref:hypothetical protein n=1 Tax=Salinisphaera sp. PC39 TaxID=1304156 RepID=UPI003340835A
MRISFAAVLAALMVTACDDNGDVPGRDSGTAVVSLFAPVGDATVPFPIDLFFSDAESGTGLTTDTTLNIPNSDSVPFVAAANELDGFSTTAQAFTDFLGPPLDLATATAGGIIVISSAEGMLTPGEDYEVVASSVITNRPRLLIRPLQPLEPGTRHFVIVTDALRTEKGLGIEPSNEFRIVSSTELVGSDANPAAGYSAAQQVQLETIRTSFMRPIFNNVIVPNGIDPDSVILAWSFTTQSIADSLERLADNAPAVSPQLRAAASGLSTGDLELGLPDTADIFVGSIDLPYYLSAPSGENPTAPLSGFWQSDGTPIDGNSTLLGDSGPIQCAAFAPSTSTTHCFPDPVRQSTQTVPVLITVPNANSMAGATPPQGGWPVVIFQHGITRNRADAFAIAPTLANAGFVTVAIDLPLHGVQSDSPLYQSLGSVERTFDLDLVDNESGAPGPDGNVDDSGTHFVNLSSLLTARDNLRQGAADLVQLAKALDGPGIPRVDAQGGINIADDGNVHYIGHSLGGIVGTVFLAISDDVNAATLAMPGGGIGRLLDGSAAFGPEIAAGLAASGLDEGTDNYETFLRFAQTLIDSGDPVNYGAAASAGHPLHMIEVAGDPNSGNPPDLVVPNYVVRNIAPTGNDCPLSAGSVAFLDTACEAGPLSGTDPLADVMGLAEASVAPPYTDNPANAAAGTVVRFAAGTHGSILNPSPSQAEQDAGVDPAEAAVTTCEMQAQTAGFLAMAATGVLSPTIALESSGCGNDT